MPVTTEPLKRIQTALAFRHGEMEVRARTPTGGTRRGDLLSGGDSLAPLDAQIPCMRVACNGTVFVTNHHEVAGSTTSPAEDYLTGLRRTNRRAGGSSHVHSPMEAVRRFYATRQEPAEVPGSATQVRKRCPTCGVTRNHSSGGGHLAPSGAHTCLQGRRASQVYPEQEYSLRESDGPRTLSVGGLQIQPPLHSSRIGNNEPYKQATNERTKRDIHT